MSTETNQGNTNTTEVNTVNGVSSPATTLVCQPIVTSPTLTKSHNEQCKVFTSNATATAGQTGPALLKRLQAKQSEFDGHHRAVCNSVTKLDELIRVETSNVTNLPLLKNELIHKRDTIGNPIP